MSTYGEYLCINTKIPHGSKKHIFIPNTVKITFNFDNESTEKTVVL